MLQVFLAEYRFFDRYAPVNAKRLVLDIDAAISFRVIDFITLVLEDGGLGDDGETVSKTTRNEELTMIVFCQFHCHMLPKCRGAFADVNGYVEALRL